ncbi:MAG: Coq4 family protein [Pseudomonadales bacterium]
MTTQQSSHRLQPLRALREMQALIRDPEDTERVFHIMQALRGGTIRRNLARLARLNPTLLARREEIITRLSDRDALARLPARSLGRAYLAFCEREGISPEGLVEASVAAGRRDDDSAQSWLERRGRDTHDLWHAVTGYGTHPTGEVCVVAFSFGQIGHLGFGLIALAGAARCARGLGWRRSFGAAFRAWRDGRRAAWLPAQDWAELLPRPLDEVRTLLRIRQAEGVGAAQTGFAPVPA